MRGALVGLGAIGLNGHVPAWQEIGGAALVAGAERTWAGRPGQPHPEAGLPTYATQEELLAAHALDFVDICTPPSSHAALATEALGRGLHVLCEKPLVMKEAELEALEAAVDESDRVLFTVHNWRYAPILREVSRRVRAGRIGTVRRATWTVERTQPSVTAGDAENWRLDPEVSGGGILVDHGWHAAYVLLEWLREEPTRVEAQLTNRKYRDLALEDTAEVRWHGPRTQAELFFTWAGDRRRNHAVVEGDAGRIEMDDDRLVVEDEGGLESIPFDARLSCSSSHPGWMIATLRDFLREVAEPAHRGDNFREAAAVLRVLRAAQDAARR